MDQLFLPKAEAVQGDVRLVGSKSITNRALLLAAVSSGETQLENMLISDDINYMLKALEQLGVSLDKDLDNLRCGVKGGDALKTVGGEHEIYVGNAGTVVRPLTALLAQCEGIFTIKGDARMYERPIGDLVDALRQLGAKIDYLGTEGYPPLRIQGGEFSGNTVSVRGNMSSQYLTSLLMTLPLRGIDTTINIDGDLVSKPYIDITTKMMASFGVEVENNNYQSFFIKGGQNYQAPGAYEVEGDASAASYFVGLAAISGKVRIHGAGSESMQGDVEFAKVAEQMGAKLTWGPNWLEVEQGELVGIDVDLNHIPDAAMTLATMALFAKGPTAIHNVYTWRLKETDRLAAMATELRKVGAEVEEGEDYIIINPPAQIQHAAIDTYDDHRMAMCFSLLQFADCGVTINDPGCTSKTFPTYFSVLDGITTK